MSKLEQLKFQKKILKERIKVEEKKEGNKIKEEYKILLRWLDIFFVLILCFNFGAVFLTNIMVTKQTYETAKEHNTSVVFYEANPSKIKQMNYSQPQSKAEQERLSTAFKSFVVMIYGWIILIFIYIYNRIFLYKKWQLGLLIFFVVMMLSLCSLDFIGNLGGFVAKVLYS